MWFFYDNREGARVTWGYINRILGQPSLIRESSMSRFPWTGSVSQFKNKISRFSTAAGATASAEGEKPLENVILHPSLKKRIEHLARATANTKSHQAPFRNMMFYGPPGTGKTMVAREIARKSVSYHFCVSLVYIIYIIVFFMQLQTQAVIMNLELTQ